MNTSEAELTDILLGSLKEIWRNPAQLSQFLTTVPPFVRDQMRNLAPTDANLRPMAKMTAQMLRQEISGKGTSSPQDMFQQARELMQDPGMSDWVNSLMGIPNMQEQA